jgi:cytochrome c-type biogenesis protein
MSGLDLAGSTRRSRILAGTLLFVAGLTAVLILEVITFSSLGLWLFERQEVALRIFGGLTVVLGVVFLGGLPFAQREFRLHLRPAVGLAAAPLLGVMFGLGWTPCIGPTLGVVIGMAGASGTMGRGVALGLAYAVGLGLPFVIVGLTYSKSLALLHVLRRHQRWVTAVGGGLLICTGLLFLTGYWTPLMVNLQYHLVDSPLDALSGAV